MPGITQTSLAVLLGLGVSFMQSNHFSVHTISWSCSLLDPLSWFLYLVGDLMVTKHCAVGWLSHGKTLTRVPGL